MKNKSNFFMKYIAIVSLVTLSLGGFFAVRSILNDKKPDAVGLTQDNPFYTLRKNATEYQESIYKELSVALKEKTRDEALVSGLVVKNYVADYYTWTNKLRFNDVGGMQFIHEDIASWVNAQALETFYNDLNYFLVNGGVEDTLEVLDVKVDVEKSAIVYDEESYDAYKVIASWTYKDSATLNTEEYQSEAEFTFIADSEGLYTIVEVLEVDEN